MVAPPIFLLTHAFRARRHRAMLEASEPRRRTVENGGMNNMVVHQVSTDGVPFGRPVYSGNEIAARAYAKEHGGKVYTPAESAEIIAGDVPGGD